MMSRKRKASSPKRETAGVMSEQVWHCHVGMPNPFMEDFHIEGKRKTVQTAGYLLLAVFLFFMLFWPGRQEGACV